MSNSANSSATPSTANGGVDKQQLYGNYLDADRRRLKFQERVAHKAFDMAMDDDVNITANRHTSGLDWKGLAVVVAGLLGLGGIGAYVLNQRTPSSPAASPPAAVSQEGTARIRVLWGDEEIRPGESRSAEVKAQQ